MSRHGRTLLMAPAIVAILVAIAVAEKTVTVIDEINQPAKVEVVTGEYLTFLNASGGTAHVVIGGNDAVEFYVADRGSRMRFTKPGTYTYTVHVIGKRPHPHTGTVIVR
jgi:plastocyanin